jgi:hypothetical protein
MKLARLFPFNNGPTSQCGTSNVGVYQPYTCFKPSKRWVSVMIAVAAAVTKTVAGKNQVPRRAATAWPNTSAAAYVIHFSASTWVAAGETERRAHEVPGTVIAAADAQIRADSGDSAATTDSGSGKA